MKLSTLAIAALCTYGAFAHAQSIPGRIQAEDYTSARDTTPGNRGGAYRNGDVDIQKTEDRSGKYNVGWIAKGESLSYKVRVKQSGTYRITLRVASQSSGGSVRVSLGKQRLGTKKFRGTGGWQSWQNQSFTAKLKKGNNTLKLDFLTGGFNINYVDFKKTSGSGSSSGGSSSGGSSSSSSGGGGVPPCKLTSGLGGPGSPICP